MDSAINITFIAALAFCATAFGGVFLWQLMVRLLHQKPAP